MISPFKGTFTGDFPGVLLDYRRVAPRIHAWGHKDLAASSMECTQASRIAASGHPQI